MKAYSFHRGALPRGARTPPVRDFARQCGTQNRVLVSNSRHMSSNLMKKPAFAGFFCFMRALRRGEMGWLAARMVT